LPLLLPLLLLLLLLPSIVFFNAAEELLRAATYAAAHTTAVETCKWLLPADWNTLHIAGSATLEEVTTQYSSNQPG
jgi:hypothetical protein